MRLLPLGVAVILSACASRSLPPEAAEHHAAAVHLQDATRKSATAEQRAVAYLGAAKDAADLLNSRTAGEDARAIYNQAVAELVVLLRSADGGCLWNRPLTLSDGTCTFRLTYAAATRDGTWDPAYFTSLTKAGDVKNAGLDRQNLITGVGGTLVGVHHPSPRPAHVTKVGITAPVTATVEFKGRSAVLTLHDPSERFQTRLAGTNRTLAADFSAPLSYYPHESEIWHGLMGALRVDKYMSSTGLFMMQPYDPDRIPVIFVHGLISTPRMWRNVINELESDPKFRGRFQCWLFGYPTGNPPAYSALRLRQELASMGRLHPQSKPYVLIGHSMGGLLSRMQVTTVTRDSWNVIGETKARRFFAKVKPGDIIDQSTCFNANPRIGRAIFICTPHRGSDMALSRIGAIGAKLISLPASLTNMVARSAGDSIAILTGDPNRMPTSVNGLSPKNPMLQVLDHETIRVPHHSIIGDRGKSDTPKSTDGVVAYWSSHLKSASTECIVPGPHGACELPETIAEVRRLLYLHADGKR